MYTSVAPADVDQGCLIQPVYFYAIDEERLGVVLTPRCDLAQQKADLVQISAVFNASQLIRELLQGDWKGLGLLGADGQLLASIPSAGKAKELRERITRLAEQRFARYHWLAPPPGTGQPLVADFQLIESVPTSELAGLEIVAALASPYREAFAARYSAYMGRIGTPDSSAAEIDGWLGSVLGELFPGS